MDYELYGWAARRYDLHTPPGHYQHDHQFVIEELRRLGSSGRILDVGCGTGVLLDKLRRSTGFEVYGVDSSEAMVEVARRRLGRDRVEVRTMQELDDAERYDAIVCLGWTINYCASLDEARDVLGRFALALRPGGKLVAQVAHAAHATGKLREDREAGPDGCEDDVLFFSRFTRVESPEPTLRADYVYACRSLGELLHETHDLHAADVLRIAELAEGSGFETIQVYDSWRRDPFRRSVSPFLAADRPR
jgi:SAM-dependent methyltransferase